MARCLLAAGSAFQGHGQGQGDLLRRGGMLAAAAVLAGVFCLVAPRSWAGLPPLPFLPWLADVAGLPAEVLRLQAEDVLQAVLLLPAAAAVQGQGQGQG